MKRKILTIVLPLLLLPILSYASGGEVLGTIGLMFFVLIVFLLVLLLADLNLKGKLLLGILFILAETASIILTADMHASEENTKINTIIVIIPLGTLLISYWSLRQEFRKY
jgi:hypothetical protein